MNAVQPILLNQRHRNLQAEPSWRGDAVHQAAVGCLEGLLEAAPAGILRTSLAELASRYPQFDKSQVRAAVAGLDRADHRVSADPRVVDEDVVFRIVWAPVTAVVNLMLDWDLLVLEISDSELADWLRTPVSVARRAVEFLGDREGVEVRRRRTSKARVTIDPLRCPLMEPVRSIA